jgi:hypothetical protein
MGSEMFGLAFFLTGRIGKRRVNPVKLGGVNLKAATLVLFGRNPALFDGFGNRRLAQSGSFCGLSECVRNCKILP